MSEPDEGIDLTVDMDKYNALVADDQAAWKAFSESDLGKWFKDEFRKSIESGE